MKFTDFYFTEATVHHDKVTKKKGKKEVVVTTGRFNPFTAGHNKIVKQSKAATGLPTVILLVKGKHQAKITDKNPLKTPEQIKMIKKSAGKNVIDVLVLDSAFITNFVDALRKKNYEPRYIYTGTDRLALAKSQVDKYGEAMDVDIEVKEIKRTDKDISATKVRQAAIDNDFKAYQSMTDGLDKKDMELLRKRLGVKK